MKTEFFVGFVKIPKTLLELSFKKKIDCYDIAVYLAIFAHQNNKTKKCYPSNRRIAKILDISLSRVKKSIKNLSKCGATNHTFKKGRSSHYESVLSDNIGVLPDDDSVACGDTGCGATRPQTRYNNNINNNIKKQWKNIFFNNYKIENNPTDKLLKIANTKITDKEQKSVNKTIKTIRKELIKTGVIH